jgi:arylsulfatase A-like enzyme
MGFSPTPRPWWKDSIEKTAMDPGVTTAESFGYKCDGAFMCSQAAEIAGYLAGAKPNVILIEAADIGYGDVGFNWWKNRSSEEHPSETPNLDALARGGLVFRDFHSAASASSASRAGATTGRLGKRTGVTRDFAASSTGGLPRGEQTLAEMLKLAGYTTGAFGVWDLGHTDENHPSYRGYDKFYGLPYQADMVRAPPLRSPLRRCRPAVRHSPHSSFLD